MAGATKLTDRGVASLKPGPTGRQEFFDSEVRGLFLRVSEDSKVWGWRYRSPTGSGQPRMRIGHYVSPEQAKDNPDALTVAGARAKARRLRSLVDEGRDPAAEAKAAKEAAKAQPVHTMEDLAQAYLTACEKGRYRPRRKVKRAKTVEGERWLWSKHWAPHIGSVKIDALTRAAICKPLDALADEGKGVTANRARALLRGMFAYAVKEGRVASNPVAGIDPIVEEVSRDRVLTDDELRAVWSALKDPTGLRMPTADGKGKPLQIGRPVRIALQLAFLSMQRRGEISTMREADVDLDAGVWTIPAEMTKGGRTHVVPLAPLSIDLIREALALRHSLDPEGRASPFVFPNRDAPMDAPISPAALSHAVRDLRAALGADRFTLHDARRSGATRLADAGVSAFDVGLVLAHASERGGAAAVTGVYVRSAFMREKTRALALLERLILRTVGEVEDGGDVVSINGGVAA